MSKQFTAAAILCSPRKASSTGRRGAKHIPELPDFGRSITIRHPADHTGGIRDQWSLLGLAGWRYSRDLITDDDVLELLARQKDLNFVPGERHLLTNSGYTVMAMIVSRVSGQSFREFTYRAALQAARHAQYAFSRQLLRIVKNQHTDTRRTRTFRLSVTNFDTAGATSLLTTVEDLARWHAIFDTETVGGERPNRRPPRARRTEQRRETRLRVRCCPWHVSRPCKCWARRLGCRLPGRDHQVSRAPIGAATPSNIATANPMEFLSRVADVFLADRLTPSTSSDVLSRRRLKFLLDAARLCSLWDSLEPAAVGGAVIVLEGGKLHTVNGETSAFS